MNDELILAQLREGSEKAYKQLFTIYYSPLCEYASQYVSDVDSEELVQELMIFLWESKERLNIETSLKSYLFRSVRNRCLNVIRNDQSKQRVHSLIYEKLKEQVEDPDYYVVNELARLIKEAVGELPEKYRETFVLCRFGDLTNNQVAEKLGVSVKTVEYRITQSLKILRVKLKDHLPLLLFLLKIF